jgi:hypothetical protein
MAELTRMTASVTPHPWPSSAAETPRTIVVPGGNVFDDSIPREEPWWRRCWTTDSATPVQPVLVWNDFSREPHFSVRKLNFVLDAYRRLHDGRDPQSYTMVSGLHDLLRRQRRWTDAYSALALLGILLFVAAREVEHRAPTFLVTIWTCRLFCTLSTVLLLVAVIVCNFIDMEIRLSNRQYFQGALGNWPWSQLCLCCVELLICVFHEPPGLFHWIDNRAADAGSKSATAVVEQQITIQNPWALIMFLRIFVVAPRLILSRLFTPGAKILVRGLLR